MIVLNEMVPDVEFPEKLFCEFGSPSLEGLSAAKAIRRLTTIDETNVCGALTNIRAENNQLVGDFKPTEACKDMFIGYTPKFRIRRTPFQRFNDYLPILDVIDLK